MHGWTNTRTHNRNVKFKTALPHPEYVQHSLPETAFNETARDPLAKENLCRKHTHTHTHAGIWANNTPPMCNYSGPYVYRYRNRSTAAYRILAAGRKTVTLASQSYTRAPTRNHMCFRLFERRTKKNSIALLGR